MNLKVRYKEKKMFWLITVLIIVITSIHYSKFMYNWNWQFHIFYRRLYYIPIILAAFSYRLKGGVVTSILISILYAPHLIMVSEGINIASLNQYFEIILFISIGIVTGKLVDLDYKKQKLLEHKIIEVTKLQNYTKNIVDSITAGVISVDLNFMITSINKEGREILGIDYKEDMGKSIFKFIDDKKILSVLTQVKVQQEQIKDVKIEVEINNVKTYLALNVFPLFDILNRVQGLVIVFEDKSREKHLEAQSIRADRLSTVGELASGVAHEIRNPMGIIKTISQVLQNETSEDEVKEGLEIIEQEVDRANKVIQSLLNYGKSHEFVKEELSLQELIKEVILIMTQYAKKHNVVIEKYIDEDIIITADKEKLKQVFINIIFNSIQAITDEGVIRIDIIKKENWVNIKVKDNGKGISEKDIKKIFNPFFTTKEEGTGLGLSIVNRIIQDHNGYISIDSIQGQETTVNIHLPIKEKGGDIKGGENNTDSR